MSARPTSHELARRGMAVAAFTAVLIALAAVLLSGGSEGAPPPVRPTVERGHPATVRAARVSTAPRHHTRPVIPPPAPPPVIPQLPPPPVALQIDHQGAGDGTVVVLGGGRCSGDCTLDITRGRVLTLTAHAPAGAQFDGWTAPAACRTRATCDVQVRGEMTVAARFSAGAPPRKRDRTVTPHVPRTVILITSVAGDHDVRLHIRGRGECALGCTFRRGARVTLRVTHEERAGVKWTGARCDGDTCTVRMTRDRAVRAAIADPPKGTVTWHAIHRNQPPALDALPSP